MEVKVQVDDWVFFKVIFSYQPATHSSQPPPPPPEQIKSYSLLGGSETCFVLVNYISVQAAGCKKLFTTIFSIK